MICPYCNNEAELASGDTIYPHRPDLHQLRFWQCAPCDARVGCHEGTERPLGRLANAELRQAKMAAHAVFDPLWRNGHMKRSQAYGWLADQLGIPRADCHIGMFDLDRCRLVVALCNFYEPGLIKQGSSQIFRKEKVIRRWCSLAASPSARTSIRWLVVGGSLIEQAYGNKLSNGDP